MESKAGISSSGLSEHRSISFSLNNNFEDSRYEIRKPIIARFLGFTLDCSGTETNLEDYLQDHTHFNNEYLEFNPVDKSIKQAAVLCSELGVLAARCDGHWQHMAQEYLRVLQEEIDRLHSLPLNTEADSSPEQIKNILQGIIEVAERTANLILNRFGLDYTPTGINAVAFLQQFFIFPSLSECHFVRGIDPSYNCHALSFFGVTSETPEKLKFIMGRPDINNLIVRHLIFQSEPTELIPEGFVRIALFYNNDIHGNPSHAHSSVFYRDGLHLHKLADGITIAAPPQELSQSRDRGYGELTGYYLISRQVQKQLLLERYTGILQAEEPDDFITEFFRDLTPAFFEDLSAEYKVRLRTELRQIVRDDRFLTAEEKRQHVRQIEAFLPEHACCCTVM